MTKRNYSILGSTIFALLPLCLLMAAGCSKDVPAPPSGGPPAGGGPGGGGGRRGAPLAADASGADIYQARCRCHGAEGKGGKAPVLAGLSGKADADVAKTIKEGKGKMPAFASQLSDAQIDKVVTYLKQLK